VAGSKTDGFRLAEETSQLNQCKESNMIAQVTGQSSYTQGTPATQREVLIDHRDELAAMVRARKLELRAALERRRNHGCGSAKAMWQMIGAIGHGQSQIAVIDLQLESLSTS
jgi:hypothetical protein